MRIPTIFLALLLTPAAWAKPPPAAWEPPNPLVETYNEAVTALNGGNPGRAEALAEKLVAKAPECGMALLVLGQARNRLNEPARALEPLRQAVALFPDRAVAHAVLAESAFTAQEFALASEESGRALEMEPTSLPYARLAVHASLRLGDADEARARLAKARIGAADLACLDTFLLAETGDFAGAKARMAGCDGTADAAIRVTAESMLASLPGGAADAATRVVVEQLGGTGYELALRGGDLLRAGRYAEAVTVLEAAQVALPRDLSIRVNLAAALVELRRYAEAEAALQEAVQGDTWIDMHASGNMTGIMTKRTEERLHALQRDAAAMLVGVQAKGPRPGSAAKTLADARARFGDALELVVAEAELRFAEGKAQEGWALLRAAVARNEPSAALARALARLAADDPAGLDPATAAYVRAHGTPFDVLNLAIAENNGRDYAACLTDAEAVLAKAPETPRANDIAYGCAVHARETDRAAPLLAALGPAVDRRILHDHALVLHDKGRYAEALTLLALYPTSTPEEEVMLRGMAVRCHVAARQWGEAASLAARPGLEPRLVWWVGQELLRAERNNDAARLLGDACPKLAGEDAEHCREMLEAAAR